MSFVEPIRLWLFVGLGAILIIYIATQARRGKYALAFSDTSLLDAVAPRRPGWRRHLVAITFLSVLGLLIVAFAGPTVEREVPRERAVVILTIDTSLSMGAEDVAPSRIEAAQEAARQFLENAPPTIDVGLVSFDENAIVQVPPTNNRALLLDAINDLELGPFTNTGGAISVSLRTLESVLDDLQLDDDDAPPAVIVLLSDGEPTIDDRPPITTAIAQSVQAGISISTVALGTEFGQVTIEDPQNPGTFMTVPVPVDEITMRNVADATGGEFFPSTSIDELAAVYEDIGTAVGFETIDDDISERFVGFALLFGFITSLLSLAWFQRLP